MNTSQEHKGASGPLTYRSLFGCGFVWHVASAGLITIFLSI